jgi:hypothetical protein
MVSQGTDGEDKRKHLEFIQGVINRMASNSFLFKGWSITIIAGISAFAAKDSNSALMIVPIISTLLFWGVDAYYLMLERAFRNLYSTVSQKPANSIDYSMKPEGISASAWLKVLLGRWVLLLFYSTVLVMLVLLAFAINNYSLEVRIIHGS